MRQATRRPRALGEATALHALLLATARDRRGQVWVATSWTLTVLHLGLLEHRDRLSPADALTLIRGSLPATGAGSSRWSGLLALASDLADGRLARHQGSVAPFGDYADSLADAAFWTRLVLRHEPSRTVRAAAIAAWVLPVVTVTTVAVRRGTAADVMTGRSASRAAVSHSWTSRSLCTAFARPSLSRTRAPLTRPPRHSRCHR